MGLLTGFFEGYNIKNCHVNGEIKSIGGGYIGGITSRCYADSIITCSSEVIISSKNNLKGGLFMVGGLIGSSFDTRLIENCHSKFNINGQKADWVGGLIGAYDAYSSGMLLKNCYSEGILFASPDTSNIGIGGFVGSAGGLVLMQNCYSKAAVIGNDKVGGFIGRIYEYVNVENCYSTGQVTGNTNVGGFVGIIEYPDSVFVTNSYWDTEKSGIDSSAAGEGRTTAEMVYPYATNTYAGWDFDTVWRDDVVNQNNGYPTFKWVSGIEENEDEFVSGKKGFELYQNYPNPFNPVTQIRFDLNQTSNVELTVFNSKGELVRTLFIGKKDRGVHSIQLDASVLESGIYFYKLITENHTITRKMLFLK